MSAFLQIIIGHNTEDQPNAANVHLEDEYVSTRHAKLTLHEDRRVTIEDLGSTNGTWVNGVRVYGEREIHPGDRLRIGHTDVPIPQPEAEA